MGAAAGIGALVGAGLGGMKHVEAQRKADANNMMNAEYSQIAPLLSMQTGQAINPNMDIQTSSQFDKMLQGGMMGAQFGASNQNLFSGAGGAGAKKPMPMAQNYDPNNNFASSIA